MFLDRCETQETKVVVFRAAAYETVVTGQVSDRPGDLEPEVVQVVQVKHRFAGMLQVDSHRKIP